jgi:hypothetical protein
MGTTGALAITSGLMTDSTRCGIKVTVEAEDLCTIHIRSPKYQIRVVTCGGDLARLKADIDAACIEAQKIATETRARFRAVS